MKKVFLTMTLAFVTMIASAQFTAVSNINEPNEDESWGVSNFTDNLGLGYQVTDNCMVGVLRNGEEYELFARYNLLITSLDIFCMNFLSFILFSSFNSFHSHSSCFSIICIGTWSEISILCIKLICISLSSIMCVITMSILLFVWFPNPYLVHILDSLHLHPYVYIRFLNSLYFLSLIFMFKSTYMIF